MNRNILSISRHSKKYLNLCLEWLDIWHFLFLAITYNRWLTGLLLISLCPKILLIFINPLLQKLTLWEHYIKLRWKTIKYTSKWISNLRDSFLAKPLLFQVVHMEMGRQNLSNIKYKKTKKYTTCVYGRLEKVISNVFIIFISTS